MVAVAAEVGAVVTAVEVGAVVLVVVRCLPAAAAKVLVEALGNVVRMEAPKEVMGTYVVAKLKASLGVLASAS